MRNSTEIAALHAAAKTAAANAVPGIKARGIMGRIRVQSRDEMAYVAVRVVVEQTWGDSLAQDRVTATMMVLGALRAAGLVAYSVGDGHIRVEGMARAAA